VPDPSPVEECNSPVSFADQHQPQRTIDFGEVNEDEDSLLQWLEEWREKERSLILKISTFTLQFII